jgi:hypothetical protein
MIDRYQRTREVQRPYWPKTAFGPRDRALRRRVDAASERLTERPGRSRFGRTKLNPHLLYRLWQPSEARQLRKQQPKQICLGYLSPTNKN